MRIVFICGSLEPGKDGVGDYTRQMAGELIKHECKVLLLAINDSFIKNIYYEIQQVEKNGIEILRIPAILNENKKLEKTKEQIQILKPDWVSLQFVPYSFHKKGLPFSLAKALKGLGAFGWHIMFHELWLDKPENWRQRLTAFLQKRIIKKLIAIIQPKVIHVSILFNRQRLQQNGIQSAILELFGNIPYEKDTSIANTLISLSQTSRLLYFGGAPRGNYLELVLAGIEHFCKNTCKPIQLILISPESENKQVFMRRLNTIIAPFKGTVTNCGFVEAPLLSAIMSHCTAGISRSEPHLLGKSGSAIAMLEHGLPIWLPKWNKGEQLDFSFRKELVYSNLDGALSAAHKRYCAKLPYVAKQFIADLGNH